MNEEKKTLSPVEPSFHSRRKSLSFLEIDDRVLKALNSACDELISELKESVRKEAIKAGYAHEKIEVGLQTFPELQIVTSVDERITVASNFDKALEHLKSGVELIGFSFSFRISYKNFLFTREFEVSIQLSKDGSYNINSFIGTKGDDGTWVDNSFTKLSDVFSGYTNNNKWLHTKTAQMLLQVFAVIIFLILSLQFSGRVSHFLAVENARVYGFIIMLLILSNLWTWVGPSFYSQLTLTWPCLEVSFRRKTFRQKFSDSLPLTIAGLIVINALIYAIKLILRLF